MTAAAQPNPTHMGVWNGSAVGPGGGRQGSRSKHGFLQAVVSRMRLLVCTLTTLVVPAQHHGSCKVCRFPLLLFLFFVFFVFCFVVLSLTRRSGVHRSPLHPCAKGNREPADRSQRLQDKALGREGGAAQGSKWGREFHHTRIILGARYHFRR